MPTPDERVLTIVRGTWASPGDQQQVLDRLALYGVEPHEREVPRVQLAILKLSEGRLDRLADLVSAAKRDYRDVLMWAEYPEEGQALWALRPDLTPEERARLEELRRRDRAQLQAWLEQVKGRPC